MDLSYGSYVVRSFYGIQLPDEQISLVNAHFFAAGHHMDYGRVDNLAVSRFHQDLFWEHVRALMRIVTQGDFSRAFDNTRRGLDKPEGWNPDRRFPPGLGDPRKNRHLFPDVNMFVNAQADPTFYPGDSLPYDLLLENPRPPLARIHYQQVMA